MAIPTINFTNTPQNSRGTTSVQITEEVKTVYASGSDYQVILNEIPDAGKTIVIRTKSGETYSAPLTEIATPNPGVGEFYVEQTGGAYTTGRVLFNSTIGNVYVQYWGSGSIVWAEDITDLQTSVETIHDKAVYIDGSATMTGPLNMGSNNITSAGTINGVDIYNHSHAGTVNGPKITISGLANDSVGDDQIAANAVTTNKIANLNITTGKIAAEAVTDAKLAYDASDDSLRAVGANHIKDRVITASKIVAGTITANEVYGKTITYAQIKDDTVTVANLNSATVTALENDARTNNQPFVIQTLSVDPSTPATGRMWLIV